MILLLDTHIVLWFAELSPKLSGRVLALIRDPENTVYFSVVSVWEIAIKNALGRADFSVDASRLRERMLNDGLLELPLSGDHVLGVQALPRIHNDLFDRVLIAQAQVENFTLVTADKDAGKYPGLILKV